jgi:hypothetical protein
MAIYFAEQIDERTRQAERERRARLEVDLAWRFATGRNMFGSGTHSSSHWRSSSAPYHVPTALNFRLKNIAGASRSVVATTLARFARIFRAR